MNSKFLFSIRDRRDLLMNEASWDKALTFAMQVIDFREDVTCYDILAIVTILRQQGDKKASDDWLKLALMQYEQVDSGAQVMLAASELEDGEYAKAIESLNLALIKFSNEDSRLTRIHGLMGCAYQSANLPVAAIAAYTTSVDIDPDNLASWFGLVRTYFYDGQYQKVLDTCILFNAPNLSLKIRLSLMVCKSLNALGRLKHALENMSLIKTVIEGLYENECLIDGEQALDIEILFIQLLLDLAELESAEIALKRALITFPDSRELLIQKESALIMRQIADQRLRLESLL